MLVDTGSPVSAIPMSLQKASQVVARILEKAPLRFSYFLGPLPDIGRITMKVQHGQALVDSALVIVDCQGPLRGWNTNQAFHNASVPAPDVGLGLCVNTVHAETSVAELKEFAEVLEKKLRCCKGPLVKLYEKRLIAPLL